MWLNNSVDRQEHISEAQAFGLGPYRVPGHGPSHSLRGDRFQIHSTHMMDVSDLPGLNTLSHPNLEGSYVMFPYYSPRADNVPLDPNAMFVNPRITNFYSLSALAQMNEQLNNHVGTSSIHMAVDMGPYHGMGYFDQGPQNMPLQSAPAGINSNSPIGPIRSLSPRLQDALANRMSMLRMMSLSPEPHPYNGASVQVKPNAPNTIHYRPAKSQIGITRPQGPPNVHFQQRFANSYSDLEAITPTQNLQYLPSGPMQGYGGPIPSHMGWTYIDEPVEPPEEPMEHMMSGYSGNGAGPMIPGGMGMPGPEEMMPMMEVPMGPGMMSVPHMSYNGPPNNVSDVMYNPGPYMNGSPMTFGDPVAHDPMPPSMGQCYRFENTQFVGPITADAYYAQQLYNLDQELYTTCTCNQLSRQTMSLGPCPIHYPPPPYFNPN